MFAMRPKEKSKLDEVINLMLLEYETFHSDSEEGAKVLDQIEILYKIKASMKPDRISMDTLAIVGGNILGILIIVGFERAHVVTSKAIGFILRPR
jgi:hypothetical protein